MKVKMKVKLKGKIISMVPEVDLSAKWVRIEVNLTGHVVSDKAQGKEAETLMHLKVKPMYAEKLKFGQNITVDIDFNE